MYNIYLLSGLILFLIIISAIKLLKKWLLNKHRQNIKKAKKILIKLSSIKNKGSILVYLRKIDPFVFEELLLCAYEQKGFKVIRNKRYTGDGGIDGKVVINGSIYLIQAKRYANHINPKHVESFAEICRKQHCKGLFIHTGKTGAKSYQSTKGLIDIISGSRLLDLIAK